ncbi:hypothetical protein Sru01_22000 [Sphaerisporangium rufum]|uniref:Uncharacterized protein n=1 Tax=Sphaerisporangium rufum TaxID=1381558 RepID=A0A919V0X1_9ACTN|nr:streptophobe family protein [Sphaerisporangium rufum]GII77218.1 hypothetical protein Sru01_22000 [Sphaerisporangium rufum]
MNAASGAGRRGLIPDGIGRGLLAAGGALAAMTATAALGLHLVGAPVGGLTVGGTAATVLLAVGGSLTLSGTPVASGPVDGLPGLLRTGIALTGRLDVVPLGVTLAGLLVLAAALHHPGRRGAVAGPATAPVRIRLAQGLAAAAGLLAGLAGLGLVARGVVTSVDLPGLLPSGGLGGRTAGVLGSPPAIGAAGAGGARPFRLEFRASPGLGPILAPAAVVMSCLGAAVRAGAWPGTAPAWWPEAARIWRAAAVPARLVAVAAPIVTVVGLGVAMAAGGPGLSGAVLLLAPNAGFVVLSAGLGVPWTGPPAAGAAGLAGPSPGWPWPAGPPGAGIAAQQTAAAWSGPHWPAVAVALAALVAGGTLIAHRTPSPGRAAWTAGASAAGWAVLAPPLTALAGGSVDLGLTLLGRTMQLMSPAVRGDLLLAAPAGLVAGAIGGLLGVAAYRLVRAVRSKARPVRAGPGP